MTGIHIRTQIGVTWKSIEIDQLTDEQLMLFAKEQREMDKDGWNWVVILAKWIRENVKN